ncbi:hypothetical protein ILUMI_20721 [Ignelater luminosus]|uniref:Eukaryotic translation initiation factor 4E transporter n=1 Tax=Ignelater luminosus TaxID=2038154 RepID=A0A8K0CGW7_IGNLU|nr:hypothetical protein ILUMI_20721 [Ignelater luminosus]
MSVSTPAATAEEGANQNTQAKMTATEQASKDRDEQCEGMSLTVTLDPAESRPEFNDPAILAAKPAQPLFRYGREELLQLREVPLSQKRPEYLSTVYNNPNGIWDPELWHRSRSETPSENGIRSDQPDTHKRRPGDPRERIRKEQDGIVLSPQRRSFNSGCFVPLKENQRSNRPHSPLGKPDSSHMGYRELPPGARRIGSGRILARDVPWEFSEKQEGDNDFGYRRERRDNDRDERFERRSFGRDFDVGKEKDKHSGRSNGRYNDRRRISNESRDEEPEWFSGGPISQHETIELRGFEDGDCEKSIKKKHSTAQKKKQKERAITKTVEAQIDNKEKQDESTKGTADKPASQEAITTSTTRPSPIPENEGGNGDLQEKAKINENTNSEQNSFNLDDILKCDTIDKLLSNGVSGDDNDTSGSRFSRWFKRESPVKQTLVDSRRSSLQDEHIIRNLLNDISEPNVTIPDSDLYFAPISPAANTGSTNLRNAGVPSAQKPMTLIEMLQQRNKQSENQTIKNIDVPGKVMSLEEIESRILHPGGGDPGAARAMITQNKQMSQKPDDDMSAFKRLLAQVSGGQIVPANNGPIPPKTQPMSILEMLSHSQQQDEAAHLAAVAQIMGPASPNPLQTPHLSNDLAFKLQQQQRQQAQLEMLSKLMNANANVHRQQLGTSPLPDMTLNQNRELLSRPEAQAILQGLKRGDITPQHLYQQLAANPAMQPRHRELLLTILKMHGNGGTGVGPSPRVLSPVPPHPLFQQQQQQLRVSPLPNAMHQRIPSPRELQVHTQNIMQRALIKKKLEEQQENFKKRQEMQQRGQSPGRGVSPAKHTASPTPLAFTPTSVLRKMTAEKDDSTKEGNKSADIHGKLPQGRPVTGMKPNNLQQQQPPQSWNIQQQLKQPGRPIVKANANLQPSSQIQQDQQQFYHQQQHQRLYNQPRKLGPQFPSVSHSQTGASSHQPSLHHFSHQQHPFSSNSSHFQQQQQLTQHQLRAQHQQHQPPQQQSQYGSRQNQQASHWSQQHHQMLTGHSYDGRASHMGERGGATNNGGDLSPTSNQLARWFSPELLERARAGMVPNMPSATAAQHAINLEEIERQTAPPVHN